MCGLREGRTYTISRSESGASYAMNMDFSSKSPMFGSGEVIQALDRDY
jgi:hypothetical protein